MRRSISFIVALLLTLPSYAIVPQWMHNTPTPNNSTYVFVPITVEASGLESGRQSCLRQLAVDRELLSTLQIQYHAEDRITENVGVTDGKTRDNLDTRTVEVITYDGRPINLQSQIVDEFYRKNRGEFTTLYRVGVVSNPNFDNIEVTSRYGASALWRSIIPGWGQFYKGANLKGGLFLGGCVVLAGGIVFTENQRANYAKRMGQTHETYILKSYQTKKDAFATGRNICIGALAALYVYNLIDAAVLPGGRRVVMHPKGNKNVGYSFVPTVTQDGAPSVMAMLNF